MTILYFSSTGNNLYVAKRLGGEVLSIPKLIDENRHDFSDDSVGIVFPVYGLCVPPYIEEFIRKISVECDYFFAIATYGFFSGAVCGQLKQIKTKNNRSFDYINKLKMAENCITFSDMAKQKGDSEKQQKHLTKIISEITAKSKMIKGDSLLGKIMTLHHMKDYEFPTGVGITKELNINNTCVGCGTCVKVCPMNNIRIEGGVPVFEENCISCGACIQNCPKSAIHHDKEKSGARYRNPHVEVSELMYR